MTDPMTVNGAQCNEIARRVFYKTLSEAENVLGGTFDAEKITALAALAEACGNDFELGDDG